MSKQFNMPEAWRAREKRETEQALRGEN